MMSLRPFLQKIQFCQKHRTVLSVCPNHNLRWFRVVSSTALQRSNRKEEPSTTITENAEPSPETKQTSPETFKQDYEYYKRFIGVVQEMDRNAKAELKATQVIKGQCHSASLCSSLPDEIKNNSLKDISVINTNFKTQPIYNDLGNNKSHYTEESQIKITETIEKMDLQEYSKQNSQNPLNNISNNSIQETKNSEFSNFSQNKISGGSLKTLIPEKSGKELTDFSIQADQSENTGSGIEAVIPEFPKENSRKSLENLPEPANSTVSSEYNRKSLQNIPNDYNTTLKPVIPVSQEIFQPFFQNQETSATSENAQASRLVGDPQVEASRRQYTKIETSYNLAVYVQESETLKQLVNLGVDLSKIEKVQGAANLIIRLDFESDIKPYLMFLKDVGIPDDKLAVIITKNPLIFTTSIQNLEAVIEYFISKNFPKENIPEIVLRAPRLLLMPISRIDGKLGFYQKMFHLTGSEVREVIYHLPKLITYDAKSIKEIYFQMKEFLGFTNSDLQKIFLFSPRVFLSNKHKLTKTFNYLHNDMGLSHTQLMQWPKIFRTRLFRIKERHEFLKHMKRHQYDSSKENYVSLKELVSNDDKTFCLNVAKSSATEFNQFLKTL